MFVVRLFFAVIACCVSVPVAVSATAPRPVLVLVVKATWGPTPYSDSDVQSAVDLAARFLETASFGQIQITDAQTPWLQAYQGEVPCPSDTNNQVFDEAKSAAEAAGFDVASYDRVIYLVPPDKSCAFSGAGSGSPITRSVLLLGVLNAGVVAHELGHTFGMGHAGAVICANPKTNCTRDPYGNPWDLMGHGGSYGVPVGDPGALQKASAGWLISYRYVSVPGTYTLAALEIPGTLPQALIVRVAGRELWIDHREAIRNDAYLATSIWHKLTRGIAVHDAPIDAAQTSFYLRRPDYLLVNDGHGSWIAGSAPFRIPNVLEVDVVNHIGSTVRVRLRWLDHSPPSPPVLTAPTGSTLSWKASRDAGTGVHDYCVSIDDAPAQMIATPSLDLSTLSAAAHVIRVAAIDYAGNASRTTTLRLTH
jgi:Gametolysin peptidase M11